MAQRGRRGDAQGWVQHKSSMQITRGADYAIRVMIHLAQTSSEIHNTLSTIAFATGAPEAFLSKVLQSLCHAGYLTSRRGKIGGFEILPAGREASLADVVEAIDGPFCLNACMGPGAACDRRPFCAAHQVWAEAQQAMIEVLRTHTIAELASVSLAVAPL